MPSLEAATLRTEVLLPFPFSPVLNKAVNILRDGDGGVAGLGGGEGEACTGEGARKGRGSEGEAGGRRARGSPRYGEALRRRPFHFSILGGPPAEATAARNLARDTVAAAPARAARARCRAARRPSRRSAATSRRRTAAAATRRRATRAARRSSCPSGTSAGRRWARTAGTSSRRWRCARQPRAAP